MNDNVESQFEFVKEIDPLMHALLLSAETSYYSAPAHTLVQTRKFAESLVNRLAIANKIEFTEQTILAKAFSGELTAEWRTQHQELITGINSAESLLAKIQVKREASKPVKKTRAKKDA